MEHVMPVLVVVRWRVNTEVCFLLTAVDLVNVDCDTAFQS